MQNKDRNKLLDSFRHHSVYTLDKNALRLDVSGIGNNDKLLIIRLLLAAVVFLCALVFKLPSWASVCLLEVAAIAAGFDIIISAVLSAVSGNFSDPCIIITAAGVISLLIGQLREEAAVFLIFQIGELFLRIAVSQVRDTIAGGCIAELPERATLVRGDIETSIPVSDLMTDDMIAVYPGQAVPVDCTVAESGGAVDVSAISGSTEPVTVRENDIVYSGSVVLGSKLLCHVIKSGADSALQRINSAVESCADNAGVSETKLIRSVWIYQAAAIALAVLTAILVPVLSDAGFLAGIHRCTSILALALPFAYVVPIPLIYLAGGLAERKNGVIFRSAAAVERTSRISSVVFDKQGTLTNDERRVTSVKSDKMDAKMMLKIAAHAEAYSSHPIAKSIINAYGGVIYIELVQRFREFPGEGIAVMVQNIPIVIGRQQFLEKLGISVRVDGGVERAVFMAIDGVYAGRIIFGSTVREKASEAIHTLTENGVSRISVTTRESAEAAKSFAASLGIREVHSQVGAAETASVVKKLMASKNPAESLLFAGASNDLREAMDCADVGAALGGSDACARFESADIVVAGGPEKLANAIISAKKIRTSVRLSLMIAAALSVVLLLMCIFGIANTWFVLITEMVMAAVLVLFSGRLMFFGQKR